MLHPTPNYAHVLRLFISLGYGWWINYPNSAICVEANDLSERITSLVNNLRNASCKAEGKKIFY